MGSTVDDNVWLFRSPSGALRYLPDLGMPLSRALTRPSKWWELEEWSEVKGKESRPKAGDTNGAAIICGSEAS